MLNSDRPLNVDLNVHLIGHLEIVAVPFVHGVVFGYSAEFEGGMSLLRLQRAEGVRPILRRIYRPGEGDARSWPGPCVLGGCASR